MNDTAQKKQYLRRYRKTMSLIVRLEYKIAQLDERMMRIRTPNFSGEIRGTGKRVTIEEMFSDKMELEERVAELKKKSKTIKHEITAKIDSLDDSRYAEVIEAYFIDCKSFDEIADDMGYTKRHVIKLYSEAIERIKL